MMNPYSRETLLTQLSKTEKWDVIVIGGGATGLGVAIDAASRGFTTVLLEQIDFAKGTSSRSTKLVHGGVRYLAQGHIDLVKEALKERGRLLNNASHLVKIQSFIIPNYRWFDNLFYNVGLKAYDLLAFRLSFGKSERIDKEETLRRIETIKDDELVGGVVYHDGQFDDSRLAVNLAQTAIDKGATVLNHFKVSQLVKNDEMIAGVVARDMETSKDYELRAKVVINATGVFTDDILKLDDSTSEKMVKPSQGIHLVVDKSFLPGNDAIMIPKTSDGRVLFLVPWQGEVLVGTTDTLMEEHSLEPKPLEEEVNFILKTANTYLNKEIRRSDVKSMFAGLRPLAQPKSDSEKTKEISRSHKIVVSDSGLVTITGGKWTTYRKMAQDVVDQAVEMGKLPNKKSKTKNLAIHGSAKSALEISAFDSYGSDGSKIQASIKDNADLSDLLHPKYDFTIAEVVWAIQNEMARTVEDILARRVRLLFLDARAAVEVAPKVAEIIGNELNKSEEWKKNQLNDFKKLASGYILQ